MHSLLKITTLNNEMKNSRELDTKLGHGGFRLIIFVMFMLRITEV